MTKITNATKFDEVIKALNGEDTSIPVADLIEFIEGRKAQAQKKASSKKDTERQKENEVLKGIILEVLADATDGMTVTEILGSEKVAGFVTDAPLTNQRITAVLRLMKDNDNSVTKEKVGKAMKYYAIG